MLAIRRAVFSSVRNYSTPAAGKLHVPQTDVGHTVRRIGVVGAGQMGIGIALVAISVAKLPVLLLDSNQNQLDKQMQFLRK